MSIESSNVAILINRKVLLKGHFEHPVIIEDVRSLGNSFELRVRHMPMIVNLQSVYRALRRFPIKLNRST
jgi:hypothetical protein